MCIRDSSSPIGGQQGGHAQTETVNSGKKKGYIRDMEYHQQDIADYGEPSQYEHRLGALQLVEQKSSHKAAHQRKGGQSGTYVGVI